MDVEDENDQSEDTSAVCSKPNSSDTQDNPSGTCALIIEQSPEPNSKNADSEIKDAETSTAEDSNSNFDASNVHYEGDRAIYTDPTTKSQYEWSSEKNEWVSIGAVQYGFEDDTHTFIDKDGIKYFWDKQKNAWFPKIDDDFMAQYQMNYGFVDNKSDSSPKPENKEKPTVNEKNEENPVVIKGMKRKASEPTWFDADESQNTKVYVNNLPTDITEQEFVDLMQKCGLVMRDPTDGSFRIKLYKEPGTDFLKGDALCTYIKVESVTLALQLLDGYVYKDKKLKVERAKFQMKGQFDPKLKPKMKKRKEKQKLRKMQEKLFDWRPEKVIGERAKHERTVIVKNLFEPSDFDVDVGLILEFQQDLREECAKLGEVRKVIIYDSHPEGVAQVNMSNPEEADEVVKLLNGRFFSKRKLTAEIWDGKTKFKIAETDSQISQRIEKWDKFLEQDSEGNSSSGISKEANAKNESIAGQ